MRQLRAIICDVDGVLADFFGAALAAHDMGHLADGWPLGQWEMRDEMELSHGDFWQPLSDYEFWLTLPVYPGAVAFAKSLMEIAPVVFATIPADTNTPGASAAGKIDWLRQHFGKCKYLVGSGKSFLAHPQHLLIDDWDRNCDEFAAGGGLVWQYPRRWNRLHAQDPMDYDVALRCIRAYLLVGDGVDAGWLAAQERREDD